MDLGDGNAGYKHERVILLLGKAYVPSKTSLPTGTVNGTGVHKGWNSQLAQWGAIIPTVQRAPGKFKCIYIIMKTNKLCDVISM